jgi:hypothetical protein
LLQTHQHSFNVFELRKTTDKPLKEVFLQAVEEFDLANKLQLSSDKLESVADSLQAAYNNNSYHSAIHPADTTQNAVHVLHKDGLGAALPLLVLFAVLLAAAGHDAAHCGECSLPNCTADLRFLSHTADSCLCSERGYSCQSSVDCLCSSLLIHPLTCLSKTTLGALQPSP